MTVPAPTTQLRLLILNTDLPVFPGGGGVEHLTMTSLARQGHDVAIVSMAHTRAQLDGSCVARDGGVRRFLWLSPWLDAPAPSTPAPTSMLRRVHARLRDAIIRGPAARRAAGRYHRGRRGLQQHGRGADRGAVGAALGTRSPSSRPAPRRCSTTFRVRR
jgi:hypothetical protein